MWLIFSCQGSSGDEREMAKQLAAMICDGFQETVAEGQESTEFWELLGGKSEYASEKRYLRPNPKYLGQYIWPQNQERD